MLLSCVQLFGTPWTVAYQAPLSIGFSRQEYWSGLPFPSPGDLPDPEIESTSPAWAGRFFTAEPPVTVVSTKVHLLLEWPVWGSSHWAPKAWILVSRSQYIACEPGENILVSQRLQAWASLSQTSSLCWNWSFQPMSTLSRKFSVKRMKPVRLPKGIFFLMRKRMKPVRLPKGIFFLMRRSVLDTWNLVMSKH